MFESVISLSIRLAAAAVAVGWGLSALGRLNATGYLLAGLPALAWAVWSVDWTPVRRSWRREFRRPLLWWKRRRVLPLVFLLITGLILLGSVMHEPNNYDGLNYRAPKVLHWLDAQSWQWIHTASQNLNYTFPNYEWLTVPLFLASKGFHLTVVLNWIGFALLPGLGFSALRLLGANRRYAYDWMWILPSGYIVALEAGGIGNDLIGLTAFLASLHCAKRFNETGRGGCLLDALLAAAFCTGVKITNLPLAAFPLIILLKNPARLLNHRAVLVAGTLLGLVSSGLPLLLLNRLHSGSFLGAPPEEYLMTQTTHPVAGWVGNSLLLVQTAVAPPLFPGARKLTAWLDPQPGVGVLGWVKAHYLKFSLQFGDLPQEEGGAFGLGVTLGLLLCAWLWWRTRSARGTGGAEPPRSLMAWQRFAFVAWLVFALGVILARYGVGGPRALLPWVALVLMLLLARLGSEAVARKRLWCRTAPWLSLTVIPALLVTPSRPLIPPSGLLWLGQKLGMSQASLAQMKVVYDVYARRADPYAELRECLPADAHTLALVSNGLEPAVSSYWLPYGQRHCVYWLSDADARRARQQSSQPLYVLLQEDGCQTWFHQNIDAWLRTYRATPLTNAEVRVLASKPPCRFTVARLDP
jgi:hypothetical protein